MSYELIGVMILQVALISSPSQAGVSTGVVVVATKVDLGATMVVLPTRVCAGSAVVEAYLEKHNMLGYHW